MCSCFRFFLPVFIFILFLYLFILSECFKKGLRKVASQKILSPLTTEELTLQQQMLNIDSGSLAEILQHLCLYCVPAVGSRYFAHSVYLVYGVTWTSWRKK